MRGSWLIKCVAVVVAVAAAVGALGIGTANAQPVTSGSLAFSGDQGDYISGGGSYNYSTAANDSLNVASNGNHLTVSVNGANGDWWYLDLAAPSGQTLAPGTYSGATRYPFQAPTVPGLSMSGNGRGCNTLTGSFTIQNVVFGPNNYVQELNATYEQHCEGGTPALRGEVHINNQPPPAELGLSLSVATDGTANTLNGKATIHGTVSCTEPVNVTVSGEMTQVRNRLIIRGQYFTQVDCTPSAEVAWSASADPIGTTPYRQGVAEVITKVTAFDPNYPRYVTSDTTTVVELKKLKYQ